MKIPAAALAALLMTDCLAFHRGPMPDEPASATFVELRGVRIRYVDIGSGPPVVLLHGFASSLETWMRIMPMLSGSHRLIALDLKGFGYSGRPPGDYSPAEQAAVVFALLDNLKVGKFALVAHSWGCAVALEMALAQPERIERLALFDAWVYDDQLPMFLRWARLPGMGEFLFGLFYDQRPEERLALAFFDEDHLPQKLIDAVETELDWPGTRAAALAAIRDLDFARAEKNYSQVRQPVLLLWGRQDAVAPLEYGERLLHDLPRAELLVYPRCGHFPMFEAAKKAGRDLAHFLAGSEP